ncbi:MAG: primosomal protein N' [Saprospiraceae bacterium]
MPLLIESQNTPIEVEVLLPIPLPQYFSYAVPADLKSKIQIGIRVEVPFGKSKLYSGLVVGINQQSVHAHPLKEILSVLDDKPIIYPTQLKFWEWMASYYCCTMGEIMQAALPAGLKLDSELRIQPSPNIEEAIPHLDDQEYMIAEALQIQGSLSLDDIRDILGKKQIHKVVQSLLYKGAAWVEEKLKTKYTVKKILCIQLAEPYKSDSKAFEKLLNHDIKQPGQVHVLLAYSMLALGGMPVGKQAVLQKADVGESALKTLIKHGIFVSYKQEISRLTQRLHSEDEAHLLSQAQVAAIEEIEAQFEEKSIVLLHGVTGSGKTNIYIEYIKKAVKSGGQVLFLLPEIALTGQLLARLERWFGQKIQPYHSKMNSQERVEIWNSVAEGQSIIIGARSALFLPFKNLQLIVIDEEHDASYKQKDPNPRYQGRDAALYLGQMFQAKILLGSATPSLESYSQAKQGKYGLVSLTQRFGDLAMPEIQLVDLVEQQKQRSMKSLFSLPLLNAMQETIAQNKQAILFQNRRGYSPYLGCKLCDYTAKCIHCDVNLTYFKGKRILKCTYCGYQTKLIENCPDCNGLLELKGTGTEKVEDELQLIFPDIRIARFDQDSTRNKGAADQILEDFAEQKTDVLAGTQMVTKGLDFEHIRLVGIIQADALLQYPDFRAAERAFQILTQVSGRAGRKGSQGLAIIQTSMPKIAIFADVINHDYLSFYDREIAERKRFNYPPFTRLIEITCKHPLENSAADAAEILASRLKKSLGNRVLGPAIPGISRVQNLHIRTIIIKMERNQSVIEKIKAELLSIRSQLQNAPAMRKLKVVLDIDP